MSFVMTPMSAAAMGAAPVDKAGVASGVLNTFRQVGVALGIGIMGAIITNRAAAAAADGASPPQAFVHGLTFGMRVSAVICLRRRGRRRHARAPLPARRARASRVEAAA